MVYRFLPFARSSEISRSFSFADMDRYSAVTETRFDCRMDRPSCEDMVVCLETGWKDEDDEVEALEAREAGCSIVATDIGGYRPHSSAGSKKKGGFVREGNREAVMPSTTEKGRTS